MPSIDGVTAYVKKTIIEEKLCMAELLEGIHKLAGAQACPHLEEKVLKLRNISRDVGWMRRLLADLVHAQQMGE